VKTTRNILVIALLLLLCALPFALHFTHAFSPRRLDADRLVPVSLTEEGDVTLQVMPKTPKE